MDFFEYQRQAYRNTKQLVLLFAFAVVCIVFLVTTSMVLFFHWEEVLKSGDPFSSSLWMGLFSSDTAIAASLSTLILILGGTVSKLFRLRKGGESVAQMLGATPLPSENLNEDELKYRNVVEEMSIASGVPIPQIYVLDSEMGINGFAAGWKIDQSAICITRGALKSLNREELQALVAHEFSHVFHGDMRFNLYLMGVLFGILMIGDFGASIMRSTTYRRTFRRRNRDGVAGRLLLGLVLWIIGSLGLLVARLIRAAISREREYLADSSAVQYTRNPKGIVSLFKKILGEEDSSIVDLPQTEQMSHFFFAAAIPFRMELFRTHPPLGDRIRRWQPGFRENIPESFSTEINWNEHSSFNDSAVDQVGRVPDKAIENIESRVRQLSSGGILDSLRKPISAETFFVSFFSRSFYQRDPAGLGRLLKEARFDSSEVQRWMDWIGRLDSVDQYISIEVALATLTPLSVDQKTEIWTNHLSLFSFESLGRASEKGLFCLLKVHLDPRFKRRLALSPLARRKAVSALAQLVVLQGSEDPSRIESRVQKHWPSFEFDESGLNSKSLTYLHSMNLEDKKRAYDFLIESVYEDDVFEKEEWELCRILGMLMEVPLPLRLQVSKVK